MPLPIEQKNLAEHLFDNQAIVVVEPIADYRHCLYQSELALVQDVSDKRMLEFSTGRDCAHQALHQLGYEVCPILKGPQREPLWPKQFVGSISHCRDLAGAVVTDKSKLHSVGFDVENIKQLNPDIARHVCTPDENDWISRQGPGQHNLALLLIFSLKEAVFKCVYQATGHSLRFKQCRVVPEYETGVAAIFINAPDIDLAKEPLHAHFYVSDSHIYSGTFWRHLPAVG